MLRRYLLCVYAVSLAMFSGCQQPANRPADKTAQTPNAETAISNGSAANFDYYLFTLSWSPEYCHGHPNNPQCDGSHPGFVVHGLWPQFDSGRWPSACSSAAGLSNPAAMLDIMPDRRLIQHEWSTHGTCSGLTANQYFGAIRKAYASIKIPSQMTSPARTSTKSASEIKRQFTDANPGMSDGDIAISCHNRYLSAVEFCLSKDLQPIACQAVTDWMPVPSAFRRRSRSQGVRGFEDSRIRGRARRHLNRDEFPVQWPPSKSISIQLDILESLSRAVAEAAAGP